MRRQIAMLVAVGCATEHAAVIGPVDAAMQCESAVLTAPSSGPPRFDRFLAAYVGAPQEARSELVASFVAAQQADGGFPIVASDGTVVFFYIATGSESNVRVIGDFRARSAISVDWDPVGEPLSPAVNGAAVWFARMRFQPDARLDYQLAVDGKGAPDPLNPRAIESGIAGHASELVMPKVQLPILRSDVARGSVTVVDETWARPKISIYLPPGYDARQRYPVVYTADGSAWLDLVHLPLILDDLIGRGVIAPAIAVMIDPAEDRSAWYMWNPVYLAHLDTVITYVDKHYATRPDPSGRLHIGTSAGGRASLFVGLEYSTKFANVALLSPSLSGPVHLYEPYFSGRKKPSASLRVWLSAGRYEGSICEDTRTMARWFRDARVATKVVYTREGHSFGTWRHVVPEMLTYFLAR
jgi:enterochelin esterase-like enzyme